MILGLICILIDIAASWYSAMYNEGRIVAPMDYSAYVFRIQDLPMIASVFLTWIYVLYLFILLVKAIIKNNRRDRRSSTSRKINPKLGFLGFLGFWSYPARGDVTPFAFPDAEATRDKQGKHIAAGE